jgi:hypothetical protein
MSCVRAGSAPTSDLPSGPGTGSPVLPAGCCRRCRGTCRRGEHPDLLPQLRGLPAACEPAPRRQRIRICQVSGYGRDAKRRFKRGNGAELASRRIKVALHHMRGPRADPDQGPHAVKPGVT